MGRFGLLPSRRDSLVTNLPARGEMWWCEMPEIVAARSWCCPGTRSSRGIAGHSSRPARRPSGALRVRFFWNPARTRFHFDRRSISTRWRASQSRSLSSVWGGLPMSECGRSAPPSPSQSTAQSRRSPSREQIVHRHCPDADRQAGAGRLTWPWRTWARKCGAESDRTRTQPPPGSAQRRQITHAAWPNITPANDGRISRQKMCTRA